MELPPALVPLSLFCTFPKYAVCCQTALILLALGEDLVPTTSLGLAHGGVVGQVIDGGERGLWVTRSEGMGNDLG